MTISLRFDRGTLRMDGPVPTSGIGHAIWDGRTHCYRAPAYRYRDVLEDLRAARVPARDEVRASMLVPVEGWRNPGLRSYQAGALQAWQNHRCRGVVVLPTGAGKTRVALAAMAQIGKPSLVLCPTRALLAQWVDQIRHWYPGQVGAIGDGERELTAITVTTFASAYNQMDEIGARFCLLVVDEAHHFGGARQEALEMCAAPYRLGLTATAPKFDALAARHLDRMIGPVVCEVGLKELVGTHLAELEVSTMNVNLEDDELEAYQRLEMPFAELRRQYFRFHPAATFADMVADLSRTNSGRQAMADHHAASAIASFPKQKRIAVRSLLGRHRNDKTLVFTALAEDAYTVSLDNFIPVITADIGRAERTEILSGFRDGRLRAIASARVLNEGLDVPDASVGIVVAGTQGAREYVQRVGRVLRPAPGKRALVYELITVGTVDHARALRRRSDAA